MSLSLLQDYSSEEEGPQQEDPFSQSDEDTEREHNHLSFYQSPFPNPIHSLNSNSLLPSALEAFSEISGPPGFLNNCVAEHPSSSASEERRRHGSRRSKKENKDLPPGAVVEAKAQLVAIRDRVRSDVEGNIPQPSSAMPPPASSLGDSKRVPAATLPGAEDAADLLRMCVQCGIPKTFSSARGGVVCPVCEDRPPANPNMEKKKGSTIKDKEKSKRMKGQSTHASWKSETEMQLRQQFD
ncbi:hypothetical protein AMTRI_Chr04g251490 [Amborella trichopoda]